MFHLVGVYIVYNFVTSVHQST